MQRVASLIHLNAARSLKLTKESVLPFLIPESAGILILRCLEPDCRHL